MIADPIKLMDHHERIRVKIDAREPGYAQGVVDEMLVSYDANAFHGPLYFLDPTGSRSPARISWLLEELIVDVARLEAIASPASFRRSRVERMIDDRLSFSTLYIKMQRQAELLTEFYMSKRASGSELLL